MMYPNQSPYEQPGSAQPPQYQINPQYPSGQQPYPPQYPPSQQPMYGQPTPTGAPLYGQPTPSGQYPPGTYPPPSTPYYGQQPLAGQPLQIPPALLAVLGGALLIFIAAFLTWETAHVTISGNIPTESLSQSNDVGTAGGWAYWAGIFTAIIGIGAFLFAGGRALRAIPPLQISETNVYYGLGATALLCALLYVLNPNGVTFAINNGGSSLGGQATGQVISNYYSGQFSQSGYSLSAMTSFIPGVGFYLAIVGALLILVGGYLLSKNPGMPQPAVIPLAGQYPASGQYPSAGQYPAPGQFGQSGQYPMAPPSGPYPQPGQYPPSGHYSQPGQYTPPSGPYPPMG